MSLIEVRDSSKNYGGLRPFRVRNLIVEPGQFVVVEGPDRQAAAVLTDLVTGTVLPDEGVVVIDGRPTSELSSQDDWLSFLDRFGLVNDRVVLLDGLSVAANLAVPLTLDLHPMAAEVRRTVDALASEVGIEAATLDAPLQSATSLSRFLVRLGRAVALNPSILIVEHPTADLLERRDAIAAAQALRRVCTGRSVTAVMTSSDQRILRHVEARTLSWRAATGELSEAGAWRRWFS
jgi:ABC-type transporter Mla maintaining outer membrane lipid asymmetry ATPase subunit MlaF